MKSSPKYDVFVFYAEADRAWAQQVLIPQLGLDRSRTATRDSLLAGEAIADAFEALVENSRFTLVVLSPSVITDNWGRFVQSLGKHLSVEEESNRIIPIKLKAIETPLGLRNKVAVDLEDPESYERSFRTLRLLLNTAAPQEVRISCPYPGMLPFSAEASDYFYGRRQEVDKILARLRFDSQRRLFVIGPSGSGKSSLMQAGVIPKLQNTSLFPPNHWSVVNLRPGRAPMPSLIAALQNVMGVSGVELRDILRDGRLQTTRALVVLDQFEEIFTFPHEDRKFYLAALKRLEEDERFLLVPVIRADFYSDLMESELWPVAESEEFKVTPLRDKALRDAIEQPAVQSGVVIDPGLVDRLLLEAAGEPGVLPLLQETLSRLWDSVRHKYLPLKAYEEATAGFANGLAGIFSDRADSIFDQLKPAEQQIAKRIFLGLVREGQGRPDTRQQRTADDLRTAFDDPDLFERTVEHLARNRLITLTSNSTGTTRNIDLAHEALIMTWKRLRDWLSTYREAQATRERLERKAEEWVRLGRLGGFLDRYELTEATHWLDDPLSREIGFSSRLRELVEASAGILRDIERTEEARLKDSAIAAERRAEAERLRAEEARRRAEEERRLRLRSVALALASHARQRIEDRERSLLMARQAYIFDLRSGGGVSDQVDLALRSALNQDDMLIPIRDVSGKSLSVLCLSPDGLTLLAAYTHEPPSPWREPQGTILYMWSLSKFEVISFPNSDIPSYCGPVHSFHRGIQALAFSGNNRSLAALDDSGEVSVFAMREGDGKPILRSTLEGFPKLDTASYWARARPVRQLIRFASEHAVVPDGDEYLSEVTREVADAHQLNLSRSFSVRGMTPQMNHIVASPDGRHVCFDRHNLPGTAMHICKLDVPSPWIQTLAPGDATAMAFSGDGRRLYVIADGCRVWDMSSWPPAPLPCSLPEAEAQRHRLLASDRDRGTVACGVDGGKIWIWRTKPESTSVIVRKLPANYDTLALCSDGSVLMAWLNGPAAAGEEQQPASRPPKILFSDTNEFQIKTEKSQIEETAYFLCGDYYRSKRWQPGDPDSIYFWRAAERRQSILRTQRTAFGEHHIVGRLVNLRSSGWAIGTWNIENSENPVIIEPLPGVNGLPLALGRAGDQGFHVASTDDAGVKVVKPDGTVTLVHDSNSKNSSDTEGKQAIWAAFNNDCGLLAVQTQSVEWPNKVTLHEVSLYNLRKPDAKRVRLAHSAELCTSVAFDASAARLALGLIDRRLDRGWSSRDTSLAPDAKSVVNGAILLYDLAGNSTVPEVLAGPRGDITALAFSHESGLLAAGSSSGKIVIYRLNENLRPIYLEGHTGPIVSLTFLPKGIMLSAGMDRTIRVWIVDIGLQAEIASARISRNFSQDEWKYYVGEGIEYEKTCEDLPVGD